LAGGRFWLWRGIFFVLFFRKKGTKKIAAVETLAEFFGEKSSENQAVLSRKKAHAYSVVFLRSKGLRGFFTEEFPCENYFRRI
jgi:hypothetical protein